MRSGAVPSRAGLIAVWLVVAATLGALLVMAKLTEEPLDDPDPAWQRPGFLDAGPLPAPAPAITGDVPRPGRAAVVFFEHPAELDELCGALVDHLLVPEVDVVVVLPGEGRCEQGPRVVADPEGRLVDAYGLRTPRSGGRPVGYAVVDEEGRIRYRTLDPSVADQLDEVATILEAAS